MFTMDNREFHRNNVQIYDMYVRKYTQDVQHIKETKFPIPENANPEQVIEVLKKREECISNYLIHETSKFRLNWVLEYEKNK